MGMSDGARQGVGMVCVFFEFVLEKDWRWRSCATQALERRNTHWVLIVLYVPKARLSRNRLYDTILARGKRGLRTIQSYTTFQHKTNHPKIVIYTRARVRAPLLGLLVLTCLLGWVLA